MVAVCGIQTVIGSEYYYVTTMEIEAVSCKKAQQSIAISHFFLRRHAALL
jgi:hypothetical protein